jgi:hypothetical protein
MRIVSDINSIIKPAKKQLQETPGCSYSIAL